MSRCRSWRSGCGGGGRRSLGCRGRSRSSGTSATNTSQNRADLDRLTLGHNDLGDHTRNRRRHLRIDLVSRNLKQRLILSNRVTDLLKPTGNRPLGNRLAKQRKCDVGGRSRRCWRRSRSRRGRRGSGGSRGRGWRSSRFWCWSSGSRSGGSWSRGTLPANTSQNRADLDRLTLGHNDLGDHTRNRRRHLRIDLVSRNLKQRLILSNRVTDLLKPTGNRPLGNRLAKQRKCDVAH